uniref:Integrase catalytic domain-containing protein n=2 Tax=Physcomitrium patens TaxID=3218 RepID=A0A2K1L892_PHYPA|nr:hypothetical protein PHYPA_000656 [Physcomitrium patens]
MHVRFEALFTKALINHCTMSRNYLKGDGLVERIIQTIKYGLWKYGILIKDINSKER